MLVIGQTEKRAWVIFTAQTIAAIQVTLTEKSMMQRSLLGSESEIDMRFTRQMRSERILDGVYIEEE